MKRLLMSFVLCGMAMACGAGSDVAIIPGDILDATVEKKPKILVLIIASDNLPVYRELQKMWRTYMHLDREHVEAYFIKAHPRQREAVRIDGDVIWVRAQEGLVPGIINKTILSLEFFLPRIKKEFSYVLRPNLSSFYYFPRLLQFLKTCPSRHFYGGSDVGPHDPTIASGCGFLLSPDVVQLLVTHKHQLLNERRYNDDDAIGRFLKSQGLSLFWHPRIDFLTMNAWLAAKDTMPENAFHFRAKNNDAGKRMTDELYIYAELLYAYYGEKYQIPKRLLSLLQDYAVA